MPFLLSPAGSPDALRAAVAAGADEVYLGGGNFNARINAKNFGQKELIAAGQLCRDKNVRLLITLNTLVSDKDFKDVREYVGFLEKNVHPDAYIIQDLGLAVFLKKEFPDIVLHASTQMQQHSTGGVQLLKNLGFSRIVMAREASAKDIKALCESGLECEVFVHGALCVSVSGGCLMSSMIGKRSGNKGECAQPCRMKYSGSNEYPLSLKDLCLAGHIPELAEMGVTALKIEGRMKSPDYVYEVTRIYRRLIDENRRATEAEMKALRNIFSRSGFTDGYFIAKTGLFMFGIRRESDKQLSKSVNTEKLPLIRRNTPYKEPETLPLVLPEKNPDRIIPPSKQKGFVFRFEGRCPDAGLIKRYYETAARIDLPLWDIERIVELSDFAEKISVILPRTIFDSDTADVERMLEYAKKAGIRQATVSNIAHLDLCRDFYLHGDYSLNVTNSQSMSLLERLSFSSVMISPEAHPKNLSFAGCAEEYIVYGRIPLMQTENCIIKNTGAICKDNCDGVLTDRTKAEFPIKREYKHRNIIYNSVPLYLADKVNELKKSGVGLYTLLFTDEYRNEKEFDKLVSLCFSKSPAPFAITRGYYK
jgi:collagenase-like PrtC family protease